MNKKQLIQSILLGLGAIVLSVAFANCSPFDKDSSSDNKAADTENPAGQDPNDTRSPGNGNGNNERERGNGKHADRNKDDSRSDEMSSEQKALMFCQNHASSCGYVCVAGETYFLKKDQVEFVLKVFNDAEAEGCRN